MHEVAVHMDDQNKNLILAIVLSGAVLLGWSLLVPPPEPTAEVELPPAQSQPTELAPAASVIAADTDATTPGGLTDEDAPRITIETPRLEGSISLLGGRIDDLKLKDYRDTLDEDSPIVTLLSPASKDHAYYALFGWAPGTGLGLDDVPGANTVWSIVDGDKLTPDTPVTLAWQNSSGLTFNRTIAIDDNYMFDVTQSVQNNSGQTVVLAPYGTLARHGEPADLQNFFVLHEGLVAMADGELSEIDYDGMTDFDLDPRDGSQSETTNVTESGWVGFTDHFWMSVLVPSADAPFRSVAKYDAGRDLYQTDTVAQTVTLAAGESSSTETKLFAGAKEWATIREYERSGIPGFIDSIDWGWFFFLTKPIFAVLHYMHQFIGNMGVAIIGLTVLIKILVFPLAYKSYASMAKMKELQPEMEKLKERAGDDRQKMQKEMMDLYKREKVNPAAGCLPILIQIPIFFSLYKVIFVTLELRHAAFFGPFTDLSSPDPTSLFNLFGLLPWAPPEVGSTLALVFLGILPLFMGVSMWLQQKLNPAPTDETQAMIFAWMPWVFMFMMGGFASGLLVYWISNNVITFTQQYLIMRSHGYTPDVFGNIKKSFKKKAKADK